MADKAVSRLELMIAGVGGRGVLTLGRLLADAGMSKYKHVVYFPNYGPAMRGGSSECTVILSNETISSPAIFRPKTVLILDITAIEEFEKRVSSGGMLVLDSTVINRRVERSDVDVFYLPATSAALEMGSAQVANLVLLGAYLEKTKAVSLDLIDKALDQRLTGGRRESYLPLNKKALREGAKLMTEYKE